MSKHESLLSYQIVKLANQLIIHLSLYKLLHQYGFHATGTF